MTKQQFNDLVGFEQKKNELGDITIRGIVKLEGGMTIANELSDNSDIINEVEHRIKEELWRLVYEDRRKLFMGKITEARRCAFWNFGEFDEKMRELETLALEGL